MPGEEIASGDWEEFFRDFTRFHQGWVVSIDVFSPAQGARQAARELLLAGIVAEGSGESRACIEVRLDEGPATRVTHAVPTPRQVRFEADGESEVLQIDDDGDTTVMIVCHRCAARGYEPARKIPFRQVGASS